MPRRLIRQTHRWVSLAFTAFSAVIFVILAVGGQPVQWLYYVPLLPLALLVVSGLYMFVAPYAARRVRDRETARGSSTS